MQSSLADSMVGLPLSVARVAGRLAYVPAEHTAKPWNALDLPGMWYWIKRRGERPSIIDSLAFGGGALYCFGAGGIEAVSILVDSALAGMPIIALTALATWAGWRTGLRIFSHLDHTKGGSHGA